MCVVTGRANILLIGARGSGKTALGRRLATRLGQRFVDLDERVLARFAEPTVSEVWRSRGEPAWRAAEVEALRATLGETGQIVALGGGTPIIDEARRLIDVERQEGRARVLYLRCSVLTLATRLRAGPGDRPSLTGEGLVEEVEEVLRVRDPHYCSVADLVYEPRTETTVDAAVTEIETLIRAGGWTGDADDRPAPA